MDREVAILKWVQDNCDNRNEWEGWKSYFFNGTERRYARVAVNDEQQLIRAYLDVDDEPEGIYSTEVEIDMDAICCVDDFKHMLRMIGRKEPVR